jgi:NADH:ubiquinone oxidoreductase subunit 4 (subunit M)
MIDISVEVLILMVLIYSLLLTVDLALVDLGLQPKYNRFIKLVMATVGGLISIFFIAHLVLFYPKLAP